MESFGGVLSMIAVFILFLLPFLIYLHKERNFKEDVICENCSSDNTIYKEVVYSSGNSCYYRYCSSCRHIKVYFGEYQYPSLDFDLIKLLSYLIYSDDVFSSLEKERLIKEFDSVVSDLYIDQIKKYENQEVDFIEEAISISQR